MKIISLALLALLGFTTGDAEKEMNCKSVRNGKFTMDDGMGGICVIERKDSIQTEICKDQAAEGIFKVEWLDDCTYTLTPIRYTIDGVEMKQSYNMICTMRITEVRLDSYDQITTANTKEGELKGTLHIVK